MKIICINGSPTAGKDTFVSFCGKKKDGVFNYSMVDGIKELARLGGWSGAKELKDRKFLSDLKDLFDNYNDFSFQDVLRDITRMENSGQVIDDINISDSISIIADPYAFQNFHSIKYVTWMGAKWAVRSVDVQYPRLILSIGGVWNDEGGAET